MKNIRETLVFDMLNSEDHRIDGAVKDIMSNGITLSRKHMPTTFYVIEKNLRYGLKNDVLKAVDNGRIIMKLNQKGMSTPSCMPWFLIASSNGADVRAVVVMDSVVNKYDSAEGTCDVSNVKLLYCLLESAYIAIKCYTKSGFLNDNRLIKDGSSIYADMFIKVLNKEYAISVDKSRVMILSFLATKFFLINVMGFQDNEKTNNYAYASCVFPNKMMIETIMEDFTSDIYQDIGTFIQALSSHPEIQKYLPGLTVRGFIQQYTMMYGPSILFALESLPYFLMNVISVNMGAYLNKQKILESIMDKRSTYVYMALMKP